MQIICLEDEDHSKAAERFLVKLKLPHGQMYNYSRWTTNAHFERLWCHIQGRQLVEQLYETFFRPQMQDLNAYQGSLPAGTEESVLHSRHQNDHLERLKFRTHSLPRALIYVKKNRQLICMIKIFAQLRIPIEFQTLIGFKLEEKSAFCHPKTCPKPPNTTHFVPLWRVFSHQRLTHFKRRLAFCSWGCDTEIFVRLGPRFGLMFRACRLFFVLRNNFTGVSSHIRITNHSISGRKIQAPFHPRTISGLFVITNKSTFHLVYRAGYILMLKFGCQGAHLFQAVTWSTVHWWKKKIFHCRAWIRLPYDSQRT